MHLRAGSVSFSMLTFPAERPDLFLMLTWIDLGLADRRLQNGLMRHDIHTYIQTYIHGNPGCRIASEIPMSLKRATQDSLKKSPLNKFGCHRAQKGGASRGTRHQYHDQVEAPKGHVIRRWLCSSSDGKPVAKLLVLHRIEPAGVKQIRSV